jgi:hypothetical protein
MIETQKPYKLDTDEKATPVMVYTTNKLILGEVVTKQIIRVSTWLRTPMMPQYITIYLAQILDFASGNNPKPMAFTELLLPSSQVIAFHIRPPASDPLDYEPNEPMRKMEPTTALIGPFRFQGNIRMSTQTNLEKYLDVIKETFTPLYDIHITEIHNTSLKPIQVQYALLRRDLVTFAPGVTP